MILDLRKVLMLCVAMVVVSFGASAQSVMANDTLNAGFVSRTVNEFFAYWQKKPFRAVPERTITLITDIDASLLPDTLIGMPVVVLGNEDMLRRRKYRKLTREKVYKVKVNASAPDTIDVILIRWEVSIEGKRMGIAVESRETIGGFVPDGRFVYDAVEKRWKASFYEELQEQKLIEVGLKSK